MRIKKIFRFRQKRRGQLNIVEVVLAASILLVLSVSVAQAGLKIAEVTKERSNNDFFTLPDRILREAEELGLLRPYFYSGSSIQLQIYLNSTIPKGMSYWLYEIGGNCLTNTIIDCTNVDTIKTETVTGSIYLSGYLTDITPKIVYLTISKNI